MKALIKKRGSARGQYYHGKSLREIVRKFLRSRPNLQFIKLDEFSNRYELFTVDVKTDRWNFHEIPKNKIIN